MYKHCRLCLAEDVEGGFNQFNYKLEDNLSVYECYKLFTLICFQNENEQIKSKICYKCLQKLTTFNNDRNQAVANNQIIASWLDKCKLLIRPIHIQY